MNSMENPIFVVGLPRSGSSLLENTLGKSPQVLRLAEVLYLSPWRRDFRYFLKKHVGDLSKDDNLHRMVEIIFSKHEPMAGIDGTFWRLKGIKAIGEDGLKKRVFERLKASDRSLGIIFRVLLQEITKWNDYERCCVAFPVYLNHLDKLLSWFPEGKIIHITRDPRAIAISKTNDPGGTANYNEKYPRWKFLIRKAMLAFVVVQYRWAAKVHTKFQSQPNYKLVRYEDFIMEPEKQMTDICSFLNIHYSSKMLEQESGWAQPSSITGKKRKSIDAQGASNWLKSITPLEKSVITWLTRSSMLRFGLDYRHHPVYGNANSSSDLISRT